jgi:hypothetical protein
MKNRFVGVLVLFLALGLLGATGSVQATNVTHTSTIVRLYPFADGTYYLSFAADDPTCSNTSNPKRYLVEVGQNGMTSEGSKNIYASALFAMGLGKSVFITFNNVNADCAINRIQVIN